MYLFLSGRRASQRPCDVLRSPCRSSVRSEVPAAIFDGTEPGMKCDAGAQAFSLLDVVRNVGASCVRSGGRPVSRRHTPTAY